MTSRLPIPFTDLKAAYRRLSPELDAVISRVASGGWYILGEELRAFESEFAAYLGVRDVVGVASGTDALLLALRACGVEPGDEVITVSHTAVATVTAIELCGATPRLVDVEPNSLTMAPGGLAAALTLRTKAIVPVHLYGRAADMEPILAFARAHGLIVVEDCAQAHGAYYHGRMVGTMGDAAAFSFYPTKNLGAMGDGGAVATNRADVAERLRLLRQYGWQERYISEIPGYNSRLDEMQAAVLRVRLRHLEAENEARRRLAGLYDAALAGLPVRTPEAGMNHRHVYHLYVIQVDQRDALQAHMNSRDVATAIHYPSPVHRQPAYRHLGYELGSLPETERAAGAILSLPLYPDLPDEAVMEVVKTIAEFWRG